MLEGQLFGVLKWKQLCNFRLLLHGIFPPIAPFDDNDEEFDSALCSNVALLPNTQFWSGESMLSNFIELEEQLFGWTVSSILILLMLGASVFSNFI